MREVLVIRDWEDRKKWHTLFEFKSTVLEL